MRSTAAALEVSKDVSVEEVLNQMGAPTRSRPRLEVLRISAVKGFPAFTDNGFIRKKVG